MTTFTQTTFYSKVGYIPRFKPDIIIINDKKPGIDWTFILIISIILFVTFLVLLIFCLCCRRRRNNLRALEKSENHEFLPQKEVYYPAPESKTLKGNPQVDLHEQFYTEKKPIEDELPLFEPIRKDMPVSTHNSDADSGHASDIESENVSENETPEIGSSEDETVQEVLPTSDEYGQGDVDPEQNDDETPVTEPEIKNIQPLSESEEGDENTQTAANDQNGLNNSGHESDSESERGSNSGPESETPEEFKASGINSPVQEVLHTEKTACIPGSINDETTNGDLSDNKENDELDEAELEEDNEKTTNGVLSEKKETTNGALSDNKKSTTEKETSGKIKKFDGQYYILPIAHGKDKYLNQNQVMKIKIGEDNHYKSLVYDPNLGQPRAKAVFGKPDTFGLVDRNKLFTHANMEEFLKNAEDTYIVLINGEEDVAKGEKKGNYIEVVPLENKTLKFMDLITFRINGYEIKAHYLPDDNPEKNQIDYEAKIYECGPKIIGHENVGRTRNFIVRLLKKSIYCTQELLFDENDHPVITNSGRLQTQCTETNKFNFIVTSSSTNENIKFSVNREDGKLLKESFSERRTAMAVAAKIFKRGKIVVRINSQYFEKDKFFAKINGKIQQMVLKKSSVDDGKYVQEIDYIHRNQSKKEKSYKGPRAIDYFEFENNIGNINEGENIEFFVQPEGKNEEDAYLVTTIRVDTQYYY